jgi:MFS family permease
MNDVKTDPSGTTGSLPVIAALGTTQTIAWASSYYLPAILAMPIARDLGLSPTSVFAALSGALIIAGLLGPRVGHAIDTFGGRGLLAISNLLFTAGLLLLSFATGWTLLIAAWIILGVGMGMGLYEAAFATLTRIYGAAARRPITGITLIAGFASTVVVPRCRVRLAHRLPGLGGHSSVRGVAAQSLPSARQTLA